MVRSVLGVMVLGTLLSTAAWAATGPAATTDEVASKLAEVSVFDEAHFLTAADDAAKSGDTDAAVQLYHSAIIYAPNDPIPYERLAEFFVNAGARELAQQYFALALDVQPAYAPALRGIALLDLAAGDRIGAQTQHEVLLRSCGASCPETTQVEKALNVRTTP
jgi:tetratricopeptide (TPR) repeat protein